MLIREDTVQVMELQQRFTGEQVRMLRDAMLDAFPTRAVLAQMVRVCLDESLDALVSERAAMRDVVFELIRWGEAQGRIEALVHGAVVENPGNPRLRAFVLSLGYVIDKQGSLARDELSALYERRAATVAEARDVGRIDVEIARARSERRRGHHFEAGEHLGIDGRYRLLRELGRGGFATVWYAWDIVLKRHVAVKVLHGHLNGDAVRRNRFDSGARKMQRLEHPGIVRVLTESQKWEDFHYYVMRFIEGGDLKAAIHAKRIDAEKGVELIVKVGEALIYSHEQGMVHGDVKPANVLLTENLEPKLTDFDLAQGGDSTTHTVRGSGMGSVLYTAPEVLHEEGAANERADVFSLGCTAFFVLLGREFRTPEWTKPAKSLDLVQCPAHVKAAVVRAMDLDPMERFATMREFVDALECEEVEDNDLPNYPAASDLLSQLLSAVSSDPVQVRMPMPTQVLAQPDAKYCPQCNTGYEDFYVFCAADGSRLQPKSGSRERPTLTQLSFPGLGSDALQVPIPPMGNPHSRSMKYCPQCNLEYEAEATFCAADGSRLLYRPSRPTTRRRT